MRNTRDRSCLGVFHLGSVREMTRPSSTDSGITSNHDGKIVPLKDFPDASMVYPIFGARLS